MATAETEIVITKIATLYYGCIFEGSNNQNEFEFTQKIDPSTKGAHYDLKSGTDAHTVFVEKKISITPISIDLTGNLKNFSDWMKLEL